MSLFQIYQEDTIKNYQHFIAKNFKSQLIGMNLKQKVRIKRLQINIDTFLKSNFVGVHRLFF